MAKRNVLSEIVEARAAVAAHLWAERLAVIEAGCSRRFRLAYLRKEASRAMKERPLANVRPTRADLLAKARTVEGNARYSLANLHRYPCGQDDVVFELAFDGLKLARRLRHAARILAGA